MIFPTVIIVITKDSPYGEFVFVLFSVNQFCQAHCLIFLPLGPSYFSQLPLPLHCNELFPGRKVPFRFLNLEWITPFFLERNTSALSELVGIE